MRQHRFIRAARWAAVAALALALVGGCSDSNPVDPSPNPIVGNSLLLGFQDEALPYFTMLDPATPSDIIDDRRVSTQFFSFGGDTTSAILQAIDFTSASLLRPYRREGTGPYRRVLDYDVPASDRQIGKNTDLFVVRDGEGVVSQSEYFATGLVGNTETLSSPRTNALKPWGRTTTSLALSISDLQRDSVLSLSFTPDPRAAIYILEILDFDNVNLLRELGFATALPMPVATTHQFSNWGFVLPGQETSIRIPFFNVPFIKGQFPITILCRVIAIDAQGRVVGRPDTDFISRPLGRDDIGNNLYELDPLGGWVITLDPYPRGYIRPQAVGARAAGGVLTGAQVRSMTGALAFQPGPPASTMTMRQALEQAALRRTSTARALPRIGIGQTAPKGLFQPSN